MKSHVIFICAAAMLFTAGCSELAAQRRYDRSMAMGTPVRANGISAVTPDDHLLFRATAAGFRLDDPDGFEVFMVRHASHSEYNAILVLDRKNAARFETLSAECRGGPLTVHFAQYIKGAMEYLTYFAYFGSDDDGILVEYTHSYIQRGWEQKPWSPTIPPTFVRLVNVIEFEPAARHQR